MMYVVYFFHHLARGSHLVSFGTAFEIENALRSERLHSYALLDDQISEMNSEIQIFYNRN